MSKAWGYGRCGPNCFHPDCDCTPDHFPVDRCDPSPRVMPDVAKKPSGCEPCSWPECGCQYSPTPAVITTVAQSVKVRNATLEECAQIAEAQAQEFLSPRYAANQPFGSICERFACDEVAKAIRGLAAQPPAAQVETCSDCPPVGYPTDKTRCDPCPRRSSAGNAREDSTCYVSRSEVRCILLAQSTRDLPATEKMLRAIDALPIFAAADFRTEPQAAPVTQNAAALAERLIQAAVDYEDGRCSKREMAEARTAVESAIRPKAMGIRKQRDELLQLADWLDSYARLKTYSDGSPYPVQKDFSKGAAVIRQAAYTLSRPHGESSASSPAGSAPAQRLPE